MRINRAAFPAFSKLTCGLVVGAIPASAQVAVTSPFLPANSVVVSSAPVETTSIELHGVVPTPNGPLFSIFNVTLKKPALVGLNETGSWGSGGAGGTFVVRSYKQIGEQDQVTVEYQGRTQTISSKTPKVASAARGGAGANNAGPAAGGTPVGGGPVAGGRGAGGPGGGGGPGGAAPGGGGRGGGAAGGPGGGGPPAGGFAGAGGGQTATPISATQAATLADAVAKQQQARANALANPTATTTPTPAPAAGAGGRGGRGARGGN